MKCEVNSILVAAHDLKAPLSLMRQLALSLDLADDYDVRSRLQSQLVSVADRAIQQVNDLCKVQRLQDGLFTLEPLAVRGLCDEVYRELAPIFTHERRLLQLSFRNRARLAVANRELLHSIIYNFCTNALHYSNQETASKLSIVDYHDRIRVSVRDYGPALPADIWRQLQQNTLKSPTAIAMRPDSSGLGLYVSSEFARHMHTAIGATRHRDGTSFYIDLPISKQVSLFGDDQ